MLREFILTAVGFLLHQVIAVVTFWFVYPFVGRELSIWFCALLSIPMIPASGLIAAKQTEWRYSPDPLPMSSIFRRTVPASLTILTVLCLPFLAVTWFYGLVIFVPLAFSGFIAGTVHLLFVEVVRDWLPPIDQPRSDDQSP